MKKVRDSIAAVRGRLPARRPRWQYLVGGSIVAAIALASGVAAAVTALEVSDGSSGGGYTYSCDQTITGYHSTGVSVVNGTVCIFEATVPGVSVAGAHASVVIHDSTILGGVSAAAAGGLQICDTRVTGSVSASGSSGFVLIGDPANDCDANNVGSIIATNNHHGLVIIDNVVHGALVASNNSGAGPLGGQTGPIVAGNHP
jgi:hypothetical protein